MKKDNRKDGRTQHSKQGFRNPYNFVSTPDRNVGGPAGDGQPAGHGRWVPGTYSGTIPVTITTKTPLLLPASVPDPGDGGDCTVRHMRRNPDTGGPEMLATSLKGALRAAFEAITNSRYGVIDVESLSQVRGERESVEEIGELRIARVEEKTDDGANGPIIKVRYIHQCLGKSCADAAPKIPLNEARRLGDGSYLFKVDHKMVATPIDRGKDFKTEWSRLRDGERLVEGEILRAGTIVADGKGQKKYERIFPLRAQEKRDRPKKSGSSRGALAKALDFKTITLTVDQIEAWKESMESYRGAEDARGDGEDAQFGKHITDPKWRELEVGTIFWLRAEDSRSPEEQWRPVPVMAGRRLHRHSPYELVREEHRHARDFGEFSAADRVFGWVCRERADGVAAAYRGHLSVDGVFTDSGPSGIRTFAAPVKLAALAQPKPQQWRFYVEAPGRAGSKTEKGYGSKHNRLRGRKFYRPHGGVIGQESYWAPGEPGIDRKTGFVREFHKPDDTSDAVTGSVSGWVKPGVTFTTVLRVENLSAFELGAVVWLLDAVHEHGGLFTIGLGRPLGFGAVDIRMGTGVSLHGQDQMVYRCRNLGVHQSGASPESTAALQAVRSAFDMVVEGDEGLKRVRSQFLAVASAAGNTPVHYPRAANSPSTVDKTFEWWQKLDHDALPEAGATAEMDFRYGAPK